MSDNNKKEQVLAALSSVASPAGGDVVSKGQVQNLVMEDDGTVRFTFRMAQDDPGSLVKDLRSAAEAVEGVTAVKVNVQLPQTPSQPAPAGGGGGPPAPRSGARPRAGADRTVAGRP